MRPLRARVFVVVLLLIVIGCSTSSMDEMRLAEDLRERDSETLLEALSHGSPDERLAAARAMGRIQGAEYAEALAQASRAGAQELRLEALFALGQLGLAEAAIPAEAAIDAVVAALADPHPEIVTSATQALGKLAPEGAAEQLVPLLDHTNTAVRREAAHALFRQRFVPLWRKQTENPPELPGAAVQALSLALADESPEVRRAAAHAFSRFGQPEALPQLVLRLDDSDRWVRLFAVRAIGRSGDTAFADTLRRTLDDEDPQVRAETLAAMTTLGAVQSLPTTLQRDPSFHVRAALARALGDATDPASLELLLRLENDRSVTVRAAAVETTAKRLGMTYAESLRGHLASEDWPVRAAAARGAAFTRDAAAELVRQAMADPDVRVRTAALESAEEANPGTDLTTEMLLSPDLALRGTALALYAGRDEPVDLELLAEVYEASAGNDWIEVREQIVEILSGVDGSGQLLARIANSDPAPSASPLIGRVLTEDPVVVLETTKGEMIVRCLATRAPLHVAGFVDRVRAGFYDGLVWHRVVPNFVIQGGDPRGDGWGGDGTTLRDEIHPTSYVRGAVGMPKAGKDTGSCQIFITHLPTPHLDGNYTVFGLVESGLEVIDEIEVGDRILRAYVR